MGFKEYISWIGYNSECEERVKEIVIAGITGIFHPFWKSHPNESFDRGKLVEAKGIILYSKIVKRGYTIQDFD
jgi:hypothetical protein